MKLTAGSLQPGVRWLGRAAASAGLGGVAAATVMWLFIMFWDESGAGLGSLFGLLVFIWIIPVIALGTLPVAIVGAIMTRLGAGAFVFALTGLSGGVAAAILMNGIHHLPIADPLSFLMVVPAGIVSMPTFWYLEQAAANA